MSKRNIYKEIINDCIIKDINESYKHGISAGCVILILCGIDAMAALSMPVGKKEVSGHDFKNWCNKYMNTENTQLYQYEAIDLWGARCGIVHRYSAKSKYSDNKTCKIFGYHDGSDHIYKPKKNNWMVLISIPRLKSDFINAVKSFFGDAHQNKELKKRIDSRIRSLFAAKPVQA